MRTWPASTVVFLDVSLGEAAKRVGLGVARPLLLGNVRTQLRNLMEARRPLYVEVAKLTVTTDDKTPEQITDEILGQLGARGERRADPDPRRRGRAVRRCHRQQPAR